MATISFNKSVGETIFTHGKEHQEAQKAEEVISYLKKLKLQPHSIVVEVHQDTIVLKGHVNSNSQRNKVITAVGNIRGVAAVDSRLQVTGASEMLVEKQFYVVQVGDTIGKIAEKFYGDPRAYNQIFDANSHLMNHPEHIYPGQTLVIPVNLQQGRRAA